MVADQLTGARVVSGDNSPRITRISPRIMTVRFRHALLQLEQRTPRLSEVLSVDLNLLQFELFHDSGKMIELFS